MTEGEVSLAVVAYMALFFGVGLLFIFVNLLVGRFLRPANPEPEKVEIYECGEPTIGSSFVQFDLRFYVVALLFIIFDVEVAFFFPWATVFGKANHLSDPNFQVVAADATADAPLSEAAKGVYREMGVADPKIVLGPGDESVQSKIRKGGSQLALITIFDIGVFFAVLLMGFAYVWRRGDLDWVRATRHNIAERTFGSSGSSSATEEQVVSA